MLFRADDRAHTFDIDETFPVKLQPGLPVQELLDGVVDLLDRYLPAADRSSDGIDHLDGVLRFEEHVVPGAYRENAGALGAEAVDDFRVPEMSRGIFASFCRRFRRCAVSRGVPP